MNIEEGRADCLGTTLAYRRRGGAGQPLVLLHGISDDGRNWEPFLSVLDPNWDVVMVDLRGHGQSADPEEGWDFATVAAEVAALCLHLGLARPWVAGHSLGGAIALLMAAFHPEIGSAYFLEDPVPLWTAPEGLAVPRVPTKEEAAQGLLAWLARCKRMTDAELVAVVQSNVPAWAESEHREWVDSKLRMSPKVARLASLGVYAPPGLSAALARVNTPMFLISADVSRGALVQDTDIDALRNLVPQLESLRLYGAGHNVRRESPAAYRQAFLGFFGRVGGDDGLGL